MKKIMIILAIAASMLCGCESPGNGNGNAAADTLSVEEPFYATGISQTLLSQNGNRTKSLREFDAQFESLIAESQASYQLGVSWMSEDSIEFSLRARKGICQINCWQIAKKEVAGGRTEYKSTTPEFTVHLRIDDGNRSATVRLESDKDEFECVSAFEIHLKTRS